MNHREITSIQILKVLLLCTLVACASDKSADQKIAEVASDQKVSEFMQTFEGRGELSDDSQPTSPSKSVDLFTHPEDLQIDLVLAEPDIFQPVEIGFDHRGRLWVVQYNQYPYPEGLKATSIDNHLRIQFDKVPEAPPAGIKGADKITFFEDLDHNGTYEKATDAITGLNIATSVVLGRGKIWVLNPPYLLAYPDPDDDGIPNGDPEVHLKGFGLEDTHAVANSLTWGPDGWLYGAQGSTTTAHISSAVSQNVSFQGQAIWRYHPESKIFEIFAEGGGNTFDIEIDAKGRLYSGDNGTDRGMYYKQGGYYTKNWGKHGPHTNPYSFGFLPNMALEGDRKRFTHAWIKYEGGTLPLRYQNKMLAINPLQSYLQLTQMVSNGSTFKNIDEERILETPDHWFRPVDIKAGPDGAVYLADWYDSRLSHVDPRDTWHKKSGRIYRLRSADKWTPEHSFNLHLLTGEELIALLPDPNKWVRQQVQRQFADRKDPLLAPALVKLLRDNEGQLALEALWAIHASGGLNESTSMVALNHPDPFVRMWGIRLLGDHRIITANQSARLSQLAENEAHPEVRSQLAATAKRLEIDHAISIVKGLLSGSNDADDRDIPLQIWWAMEAKIATDRDAIISIFKDPSIWKNQVVQTVVLSRLAQRLIMPGTIQNYTAVRQLLSFAPSTELAKALVAGIYEGLRGKQMNSLPADFRQALLPFAQEIEGGALSFGIRSGDSLSILKAIEIIGNEQANLTERLTYTKSLGEFLHPGVVPVLLEVIENPRSPLSLKQAALVTLRSYSSREIGIRVTAAYPDKLRADPDVREAALTLMTSDAEWAKGLLRMVDSSRQIAKSDIPPYLILPLHFLGDSLLSEKVEQIWPDMIESSQSENEKDFKRIFSMMKGAKGSRNEGRQVFADHCGACHKMENSGGDTGPDLTGYDNRNIQDLLYNIVYPNADIREGYVNHLITTKDGKSYIGTIQTRRGDLTELRTSSGELITIASENIQEMQAIDRSLMPEGLLRHLTDQEIQDLFAFMASKP